MDLFVYIKNALPILGVVQEFVNVKPAGHYWKGSCPFHSETDASFTVSPDRQIFYCFGCHASGDVIAFIAKLENLSQIEAARFILDRYNITVPEELLSGFQKKLQQANLDERNRYYVVCEKIAQWCHLALKKNSVAFEYVRSRGMNEEVVLQFCLGILPGGTANVQAFIAAMAQEGVLVKELISYGFLGEAKSYFYSPFEERILFPIKDTIGRVCGFGGRVFRQGDERAKYYNSRESDWFVKGKLLYGFDVAKKAMQFGSKAILVEGYIDVIALVQAGFKAAVATLGTACTIDHLRTLARHVHTLYVLYDGDKAGQAAILRMTELCWETNLELMVVSLPSKEDPASFIAKGGDIALLLEAAQSIINFFVSMHLREFKAKPLALKMAAMHKIFDIVLRLKDPLKADLLIQQAALAIDLPFQSVKDGLRFYMKENSSKKMDMAVGFTASTDQAESPLVEEDFEGPELEKKILYVIICNLQDQNFFIEEGLIFYFSPSIGKVLSQIFGFGGAFGKVKSENELRQRLGTGEQMFLDKVMVSFREKFSLSDFQNLKNLFCKYHWKRIAQDLKKQMQQAQLEQNDVRLRELMKMFSELKQGFADKGLI